MGKDMAKASNITDLCKAFIKKTLLFHATHYVLTNITVYKVTSPFYNINLIIKSIKCFLLQFLFLCRFSHMNRNP